MQSKIQLSQHDQLQLELKAEYPVDANAVKNDYCVDVYFFLPRNLAVNELTYTSQEFYNDFSEYIRLKTPAVLLADMAKPGNAIWHKLDVLKDSSQEEYEKYIKLFCSMFRSSMRDAYKKILKSDPVDVAEVENYITDSQNILHLLRSRRENFTSTDRILEFFDLANEYAGVVLTWHYSRLYKCLETESNPDISQTMERIAAVVQAEDKLRTEAGSPSVPEKGSDNSLVIYRESILKKTMASILFLNMETRRDGMIVETLLMGLAAAVAMIFVTAIAFLWQGLYLQEFSISFFVVWVVAYMFKDRIKFLLQNYFSRKRSRYSYDYRQKIFDNMNNEVGVLREGFLYCKSEKIPPAILKVRNKTELNRTETGSLDENILLYRKKIELKTFVRKSFFSDFDVNGVVNICRLNIRHWLNKMDNPVRTIYTSDGRKLMPLSANRDYHVNIVIRTSSKNMPEAYARYRMILSRNGIRRLETFNQK